MPSDDLILSVRQAAGFPPALNSVPSDAILIQRGGLGGPYLSSSPVALVGTALANGGDMAIGGKLSVAATQGGSAQFSNGAFGALSAQKGCFNQFDAAFGTVNGNPIATVNYVDALFASGVASVNGRTGAVLLTIWDVKGGAPIHSPRFTGSPMAPTPASKSCSNRLATTAFVHGTVMNYLQGFLSGAAFVSTFNGRSGDVVLTAADIEAAGATDFAPIDSPNFSGLPTAPTADAGTSTGQLATTAFVMNAIIDSTTGVVSWNGRVGAVTLTAADVTGVGGALLASPVFTGTPQAPTAPLGTSTGQLATTAFVLNELGGLDAGVVSFNGRSGAVTLNSTDISNAGGALAGSYVNSFNGRTGNVNLIANDISAVGGLINPNVALTGTPTAPTAAPATNSTQLATTAFVAAAIAAIALGVTSFNTRSGAVTLTLADITNAGGAANSSLANYLPLAGGTVTGLVQMNGGLTVAGPGSSALVVNGPAVLGPPATPSSFNAGGNLVIGGLTVLISGSGSQLSLYGASNVYSDTATFGYGESGPATSPGWRYLFYRTSGLRVWYDAAGNSMMTLVNGGNLTIQGTLTQNSDGRMKRDIKDGTAGMAQVRQLQPKTFRRVHQPPPPDHPGWAVEDREEFGFIAQEVEPVIPDAVGENANGLTLDLMALIATLTNAVKDLDVRLSVLEGAPS